MEPIIKLNLADAGHLIDLLVDAVHEAAPLKICVDSDGVKVRVGDDPWSQGIGTKQHAF